MSQRFKQELGINDILLTLYGFCDSKPNGAENDIFETKKSNGLKSKSLKLLRGEDQMPYLKERVIGGWRRKGY